MRRHTAVISEFGSAVRLGVQNSSLFRVYSNADCCAGVQNSSRYVEIFSSNREEMERRPLTGGMLV